MNKKTVIRITFITIFGIALLQTTNSRASYPNLDPTFGDDGVVTTNLNLDPESGYINFAQYAFLQEDDKIIVIGDLYLVDIGLARYDPDGSLDPTFGGTYRGVPVEGFEGRVVVNVADFIGSEVYGSIFFGGVQTDGKIVVVGLISSSEDLYDSDPLIMRFNPDGTIDTGFGENGRVNLDDPGSSDHAWNLALQPDGKILVIGSTLIYPSNEPLERLWVLRLHSDGSLDTSFDSDGYVITDLASSCIYCDIWIFTSLGIYRPTAAIQSDGKIFVAGGHWNGSDNDIVLIRLNVDGSFDTSFGNEGYVVSDISGGAHDFSLITSLQDGGKILVAGTVRYSPIFDEVMYDAFIARYNNDGSLDGSFGEGGIYRFEDDQLWSGIISLIVEPDEKIMILRINIYSGWELTDFRLARLNTDGSLDESFDRDDGEIITDISWLEVPVALLQQSDGKFVVAGSLFDLYGGMDFFLVRFLPDIDGDGVENGADNAPDTFNPDQNDIDSDGVGDVQDICPSNANNTCNPDGSAAVSIGVDGGSLSTTNGDSAILVPQNALPQETSISVTDVGMGFLLNTDLGEATAVLGIEIGPPGTVFNVPIEIVLTWDDLDNDGLVDGTSQLESELFISKDGIAITDLCSIDPGCDQTTNTFSFTVDSLSVFVLATLNNYPPQADVGGPYTIPEGSTIPLTGSGNDPDGDPISFSWDLDHDGVFETTGQEVLFSAEYLDGPSEHTIALQVCDDKNACDSDEGLVYVQNAVPSIVSLTSELDPVQLGTSVGATVVFSDPGQLDTHRVEFDWGDGFQTTVDDATSPTSQFYTYTNPGVFTIKVIVSDDDGDFNIQEFHYVVVYDPDGGFVTGGGWFNSPPGACRYESCIFETTGKATFGFVSKYHKGASIPSGNTEFQFKAGNLNFHSTTYQWLVVTGSNYARYKGSGSINGELAPDGQEYMFMIWAGDGNPDTFRIKIWYEDAESNEIVIYDNGFDQGISGGSIVVHTK